MRQFNLIYFTVLFLSLFNLLCSNVVTTDKNRSRQHKIKEMMLHAWSNYKLYAWGGNELCPTIKRIYHQSVFGPDNIGATIIDAMDTLYLMGLKREYEEARDWIANEFTLENVRYNVSVFETTIRYVGGFLSLYALTGDSLFKDKAQYVAEKLLPAFNSPTGIPYPDVNFKFGFGSGNQNCLSEFGTLYLEFAYLSEITDNPSYKFVVDRIYNTLEMVHDQKEPYPLRIDLFTGIWGDRRFSIGAYGDSFYEYLLKVWIQSGYKDNRFREKFLDAITNVIDKLVRKSVTGLVYLSTMTDNRVSTGMEHLACFTGGLFALAANTSIHKHNVDKYMKLAKEITRTCHESYVQTPAGLGPETFHLGYGPKITSTNRYYLLRPETVESYFYLWRVTHDQKYREWGWETVQALEKHCRTPTGYCGVTDVFATLIFNDNVQQSFFLAETLKYLYLLYSDDTLLPLDKWVFNTEAHPLPIMSEHHLKCRRPKIFNYR